MANDKRHASSHEQEATLYVRLSPELKEALQDRANVEKRSLNNYILRLLEEHVGSTVVEEKKA